MVNTAAAEGVVDVRGPDLEAARHSLGLGCPYTEKRRELLRRITTFFNARDWRRRLGR